MVIWGCPSFLKSTNIEVREPRTEYIQYLCWHVQTGDTPVPLDHLTVKPHSQAVLTAWEWGLTVSIHHTNWRTLGTLGDGQVTIHFALSCWQVRSSSEECTLVCLLVHTNNYELNLSNWLCIPCTYKFIRTATQLRNIGNNRNTQNVGNLQIEKHLTTIHVCWDIWPCRRKGGNCCLHY